MERENFENEWKSAFEQAEISPSDSLWTSIELDLERAEGEKMKRKLLHYKLMAAASVTFALCFAGFGFYYLKSGQNSAQNELAVNATVNSNKLSSEQITSQNSTEFYQTQKSKSHSQGFGIYENQQKTENLINEIEKDGMTNQTKESLPSSASEEPKKEASKIYKIESGDNGTMADRSGSSKKYGVATLITKAKSETNTVAQADLAGNHSRANAKNEKIVTSDVSDRLTIVSSSDINLKGTQSESSMDKLVASKDKTSSSDQQSMTNDEDNLTAGSITDKIKSTKPNTEKLISEREIASGVFTFRKLPSLIDVPKIEFHGPEQPQEDPFKLMMARLEKREAELAAGDKQESKKRTITEKLWTSLSVAAGNFNSSNSNVKASSNFNSIAIPGNASTGAVVNQSKASGTSYAAGLHIGAKVSERWVLQGGVNYMNQTSAYQSDAIIGSQNLDNFRAASFTELNSNKANDKTSKLIGTSNYSVNNSVQYVSVPVQAGYIAINHTLAFQINAGASTDLFIQNTITPENSNLEKVTQSRGDDSPYRSVNFSGLFGTEVSYRFGRHYRIALNPGLKYPLNSIYKAEVGVTSRPITMDVAMRFRYIF